MSTEQTSAKLKQLSVTRTIELIAQHRPDVEGIGALYGLLFHQSEMTLDARRVADAYATVAAGGTLPRLGLSHHGVQIAAAFDAQDWDRVRPPLQMVARGDLPNVQRFVVESARRILAVEQIQGLAEGPAAILLALIDPTCPPAVPTMLRQALAENDVALKDLVRALASAPLARPFVIGVIDTLRRAR